MKEKSEHDQAIAGPEVGDFAVSLKSAQTPTGVGIEFGRYGVTAIVGGNNSGKSTFLRELRDIATSGPKEGTLVLTTVQLNVTGSLDSCERLVENRAAGTEDPNRRDFRKVLGESVYWPNVSNSLVRLVNEQGPMGHSSPFFLHYSDPTARHKVTEAAPPRPSASDPPEHPLHILFRKSELQTELIQRCQAAFGLQLTYDPFGANHRLRIGRPPTQAPVATETNDEYLDELTALPDLEAQGDGMRSYIGALLPIVASSYPMIIMDEPEAFLHPPQARQLGRALAEVAASQQVQVVLATHDKNLLAGLLESQAAVSIVRLSRSSSGTTVRQLTSDELASLWQDPILRYTNVLDGLFHNLVVLFESETDCTFLGAVLDAATFEDQDAPRDVLFIPTSGWSGMAKVAKALRAVGVRVVAAPDMDILSRPEEVEKLVSALGGDATVVAGHLDGLFRQLRAEVNVSTSALMLENARLVLELPLDDTNPDDRLQDLRNALKKESVSGLLKSKGTGAFSSDGAKETWGKLSSELHSVGVVMPEVGELERFYPDSGKKGLPWLTDALEGRAHETKPAVTHLHNILSAGTLQREATASQPNEGTGEGVIDNTAAQ